MEAEGRGQGAGGWRYFAGTAGAGSSDAASPAGGPRTAVGRHDDQRELEPVWTICTLSGRGGQEAGVPAARAVCPELRVGAQTFAFAGYWAGGTGRLACACAAGRSGRRVGGARVALPLGGRRGRPGGAWVYAVAAVGGRRAGARRRRRVRGTSRAAGRPWPGCAGRAPAGAGSVARAECDLVGRGRRPRGCRDSVARSARPRTPRRAAGARRVADRAAVGSRRRIVRACASRRRRARAGDRARRCRAGAARRAPRSPRHPGGVPLAVCSRAVWLDAARRSWPAVDLSARTGAESNRVAGASAFAERAHVTLQPKRAPADCFVRLNVRVPNERDNASTKKVRVQFPPGVLAPSSRSSTPPCSSSA